LSSFKPQTRIDDAVIPDELVRLGQLPLGTLFFSDALRADFTKNNDTTLENVPTWTVALNANRSYYFFLMLSINGSAVADVKEGLVLPAAPVGRWFEVFSPNSPSLALSSSQSQGLTGANDRNQNLQGMFLNVNAGNFSIQFAQNTAEVSDTILRRGSLFAVWESAA